MINLNRVRTILKEVEELVDDLDGVQLDERNAIVGKTGGNRAERASAGKVAREEKARQSQALNLLSDRLALAASLVRVEYWAARGYSDPTVGADSES